MKTGCPLGAEPHTSLAERSLFSQHWHTTLKKKRKGCQLWLSNKNKSVLKRMIIFSKRKEWLKACVCVLVAQSCGTPCDPMDYSPTDFSVHGILQGGILGWVPISFSRASSPPRNLLPSLVFTYLIFSVGPRSFSCHVSLGISCL